MSPSRHAFTLVELLVVITIIGILAGLLLTAVVRGVIAARQTQIAVEIGTISQSIEEAKNNAGGAYPPDIGVGPTTGGNEAPAAVRSAIAADLKRFFRKAFPRHREPDALFDRLAGVDVTASRNAGGLNPAEALVFWLQAFSSDPQYPVSGPGGPSYVVAATDASNDPVEFEDITSRNWIGNFEPTRYGMLVNGSRESIGDMKERIGNDASMVERYVRYDVDSDNDGSTETRQINLWQYFPPNSPQPLVYFDASRGVRDINHVASLGAEVHPIKQLKASRTDRQYGNLELVNSSKFQVLHCGLDEEWSGGSASFASMRVVGNEAATTALPNEFLLYPNGPFTLELADTIVSFSDKATLEDNQP